MTPDACIKAGALALTRRRVREIFEDRCPITISVTVAGKTRSVQLDPIATKAALDAADFSLSERMKKLGVNVE